jgi:hypothetical protein
MHKKQLSLLASRASYSRGKRTTYNRKQAIQDTSTGSDPMILTLSVLNLPALLMCHDDHPCLLFLFDFVHCIF